MVLRTVQKVLNAPEFMRRVSDTVIDNLGFIAPLAALVKWKQRKLVTEQAKIEDEFRQIVEAGTKMDSRSVQVPSETSNRPPT